MISSQEGEYIFTLSYISNVYDLELEHYMPIFSKDDYSECELIEVGYASLNIKQRLLL